MKNSKEASAARHRTTSDFLLSEASDILENRENEGIEQDPAENWIHHPARRVAAAFLEKVLPAMRNETAFSAWIIEIDPTEKQADPTDRLTGTAGVEKTIHTFCQGKKYFWSKIDSDRLAVVLPGASLEAALAASRILKRRIQASGDGTVTIGIAVHPTPGFQEKQTLENAEKALVHAKFFGPDSTVPFDAVSLNISGDQYYENGDIHGAIEEFEAGLHLDPLEPNLHNSLGVCYGVTKQYELARIEFAEAMKLQPEDVMPVYNAGLAEMFLHHRKAALELFEKAARIGEKSFEVALQTGRCLLEMDAPDEALTYLRKALAERPENGSVHCLMGQCFEKQGLHPSAIQALKKAVTINPSDGTALSLLGWVFYQVGENSEIALLFCRKSVEIEPENGLFRQRLGIIMKSCGQEEAGAIELQKASQLGIDFPEVPRHNVEKKTGTSGT